MIDWKVEDLSPGKNKGILRHIIEPGKGSSETPNDGTLVTGELSLTTIILVVRRKKSWLEIA